MSFASPRKSWSDDDVPTGRESVDAAELGDFLCFGADEFASVTYREIPTLFSRLLEEDPPNRESLIRLLSATDINVGWVQSPGRPHSRPLQPISGPAIRVPRAQETPETADEATLLALAATRRAWRALRAGVFALLLGLIAAVCGFLVSTAPGLALLFVGCSAYCAGDYAASRLGDRGFLPIRVALLAIYGCAGLALTMLVAAL